MNAVIILGLILGLKNVRGNQLKTIFNNQKLTNNQTSIFVLCQFNLISTEPSRLSFTGQSSAVL